MLCEVLSYTERCGLDRIPLKDYRIVPEDLDKANLLFSELLDRKVENCEIMSVDLMKGVIDYESSMVRFPQMGTKFHITDLIFGCGPSYCDVLKVEKVQLEDLIDE